MSDLNVLIIVQWHEAETVFHTPDGSIHTPELKPFASQGAATTGSLIGEPGRSITAQVALPAAIPNARLVFRYARQHWGSHMQPSQIDCVTVSGGKEHVARLIFEDTKGWGQDNCNEWRLAECPAGDLKKGPVTISLTSRSKYSDAVLDGFFIVPEVVRFHADELSGCGRVAISSEKYIGIGLPNSVINQYESTGFKVVGRGFTDTEERVSAVLQDAEGKQTAELLQDALLPLSDNPESVTIGPEKIEAVPDGNYTLNVSWAGGTQKLSMPFTVMGDVIKAARKQHDVINDFMVELDAEAMTSVRTDLRYLEEYTREVLNVLDHRIGKTLPEEVLKRTKDYFWHMGQFTTTPAWKFMDDLQKVICQSNAVMANIRQRVPAYGGVRGVIRKAYVSRQSGELREYQFYVPSTYTDESTLPLLLFWGGTENMFQDMDSGVSTELLEARGCVMVAPKIYGFDKLKTNRDLVQMVETILADYPGIARDRVFTFGGSSGGFGSYMLATRNPDLIAGIGCLMGCVRITAENEYKQSNIENNALIPTLNGKKIFIGHGDRDRIVPKAYSDFFAAELDRLGIPYKYDVYEDVGHDIKTIRFINEMLDWFEIGNE